MDVACHACGRAHSFGDIVPFRAECEACSADLHACVGCRFYDRFVEKECREDSADPVERKDRRNLCEYWKPKPLGDAPVVDEAAAAKAKLAALFGGAAPSSSPSTSPSPSSAADEAKRKLEALFKKP